jgi:hypothetical protein
LGFRRDCAGSLFFGLALVRVAAADRLALRAAE